MKNGMVLTTIAVVGIVSTSVEARAQLSCGSSLSCPGINSDAYGFDSTGTGGTAVIANATNTGGVGVNATGNAYGLIGQSVGTAAVEAIGTQTAMGLYATSSTTTAVEGISAEGTGVWGITEGEGWGVHGEVYPAGYGTAVYGDNNSTVSGAWAGYFSGAVNITHGVYVAGSCISGTCSSDERLKTNIKPLTGSLDAVTALRPVTFEWKNPGAADRPVGTQTGFIAQEVEKVEPSWVHTDPQGFKMVNRDTLPMLLVDSIKTLKTQNDDLRGRVASLEAARRPLSQNFGMMSGLGLFVVGGAFMASRRKRTA
jgi:Chaperone of endosialidase